MSAEAGAGSVPARINADRVPTAATGRLRAASRDCDRRAMPRQLAVGASRLTRVRPASAEPQTEGAIMPKFLQKKEAADPLAFMRRITQELDRAFGLRGDVARLPEMAPLMWTPEIEVFERDEEFIVRVDLPGLKKEDVKIEVTHDELTIEGERKLEKETREGGVHQTERAYGKFYRRIWIPEYVKAENAVATFKNGVLEIEMPVIPVPEVKKRTVAIAG
jgi:HSP20 family protein